MPINKFGISLGRSGTDPYYQYSGLIRNYVRDNALCVATTDFDAKSRKIRRVALPVDDSDAVNKRYVQQNMQILKNQQDEMEKKIATYQNNVQIMINELREMIQHMTHCQ